ncbi:uncharacterized protein LOC134726706 [Mytilus trossulus]|uniref:uncharacterized protein LOC134726706 n=1 Tax=Mytilus trossulus TaxID=6551 RepID=UPI00300625BB
MSRYSNLHKVLTVPGCVLRFVKNCQEKRPYRRRSSQGDRKLKTILTKEEMSLAMNLWIKDTQQDRTYQEKMASSVGTTTQTPDTINVVVTYIRVSDKYGNRLDRKELNLGKHWSEIEFREALADNFKGIRRAFRQKDADPIGDDIGLYYKDVTKRKKCKLLPFPNYVKTTQDLIGLFNGSTSNIEFFIQRNHDGQADSKHGRRKLIAEGLFDATLLAANINQLRNVIDAGINQNMMASSVGTTTQTSDTIQATVTYIRISDKYGNHLDRKELRLGITWPEREFRAELADKFKDIKRESRQKDADPIGDDVGLYYKDVKRRKKLQLFPFPNYVKTTQNLIDLFDGSTSNIEFYIQRNHDGQADSKHGRRKLIAEGLFDMTLFAVNINQLIKVMDAGSTLKYYKARLGLLGTSLLIQFLIALLVCVVFASKNSSGKLHHFINVGIMFLTSVTLVLNISIVAFDAKQK